MTLFLLRRNESQAVASELFGCSQSLMPRSGAAVIPR